jgi:phosphoribosyl-ATP pyrophosphohydrolase
MGAQMMTVMEFAARYDMDASGAVQYATRRILRRLRALEKSSGHKILFADGDERKRMLVSEDAYALAVAKPNNDPKPKEHIDEVADEIAARVRSMDERHTELSLIVAELKKDVDSIKKSLGRVILPGLRRP